MDLKKIQFVRDISNNDEVLSIFAITQATLAQARNGPYWRLELSDMTGAIGAKAWSPLAQQFPEIAAGQMLAVKGRASTYRDILDINIEHMKILTPEDIAELDMGDFVAAAERHPDDMYADLLAMCTSVFTYAPWMTFVESALADEEISARFKNAIGAKNVHHAYLGGLLEHSLSVAELCMKLCDHYPELDRQVLLAGAIFHDIGKAWELSAGLVKDYTDEGRLIGHINIGLEKVEPYLAASGLSAELQMHFKHLILGHHGQREWGSPVLPATAEALVLHYADNIDAKLAQLRGLFSDFEYGDTGWTPYQNTLGRFIFKPTMTPPEPNAFAQDVFGDTAVSGSPEAFTVAPPPTSTGGDE